MSDQRVELSLSELHEASDLFAEGMARIAETLGTPAYDNKGLRKLTLTFTFSPMNSNATDCAIITSLDVEIPRRLSKIGQYVIRAENGDVWLEKPESSQ